MGRVVTIVERGFERELEDLDPIIADADRIASIVAKHVSDDAGVVVVGAGMWRRIGELLDLLQHEAVNPFLVRPVDAVNEPKWARLSLAKLVLARIAGLARSVSFDAPYTTEPRKVIDRRSLFRLGPAAALSYRNAPVLVSAEQCSRLNGCKLCIENCPNGALQGKPPRLEVSQCTTCSICIDSCPISVIDLPMPSLHESVEFLYTVRNWVEDEPAYVVYACMDMLPLLGEVDDPVSRTLVIPVHDGPEAISVRLLLASRALGYEPIVFCRSKSKYWSDYIEAVGEEPQATGSVGELSSILQSPPRVRVSKVSRELLNLVVYGIEVEKATFTYPITGLVHIDKDKCTLCGGCTNICPTNALVLGVLGSEERLVFRHELCIACRLCEEKCPENAIKVENIFDKGLVGKEIVLVGAEQARCLACGKPVGPMSLVLSVARSLAARSLPLQTLVSVWLCNECKVKASLGLLDTTKLVEEYRRRGLDKLV